MSEQNLKFIPQVQVQAESYKSRMSLISFINAHCQVRDSLRFSPKNILIIGVGLGLESAIFKSWGIRVTTMDIDPTLNPDYVSSVDDLSEFVDNQFDVVIVAHVLEHLPFEYFEQCLSGISRVGRNALIYLPFACIVPEFRLAFEPIFRHAFRLRIPLFWKTYRFNGEHYWEIGVKGHSLSKIRSSIFKYFSIVEEYHNWDWRYSYNFVLACKEKVRSDDK